MADKEEIEEFLLSVDDEENGENAIYRTSLVGNPATQKLFAVFSNQENKNLDFKIIPPSEENEQVIEKSGGQFERIISGVWFMPDVDYPRYDWFSGEFFTTRMERAELKKAVKQFVKSANVNTFDTHHDTRPLDGLQTMEIWVLDDHKQLSPILGNSIETLGYDKKDIPLGTVFMTVYIRDEAFFKDKILSGEVKGFSIEGMFNLTKKQKEAMKKVADLFAAIGLVQDNGTLAFSDGKQLKITKEGGVTIGDKAAPNGDYKMKSGFQVVVRDGKVSDFGFEDNGAAAADAVAKAAAAAAAQKAVADAAAQAEADRKAAEQNTTAKAEEQRVAELVAKNLKEIADKKAADDAVKAAKDAEKAAHDAEIAKLQAELDEAKSKQKITKTTVVVAEYDKDKFNKKTVGGKEYLIPK